MLKNAQDAFRCRPPGQFPLRIHAGDDIAVTVDVTPRFSGVLRSILSFSFRYSLDLIGSGHVSFRIGRFAQVRCCNPDNFDIIKPTSPYVKAVKPRKNHRKEKEVVEGIRPEGGGSRWLNDCPEHNVPGDVVEMTRSGEAEEKLLAMQQAMEEPGGYARLFKYLLWVEELSMLDDIATFNMERATLRPDGSYLALQVPGLAEKRPSVLKGDSIVATPDGIGKGYSGYVHHVSHFHHRNRHVCTSSWLRVEG